MDCMERVMETDTHPSSLSLFDHMRVLLDAFCVGELPPLMSTDKAWWKGGGDLQRHKDDISTSSANIRSLSAQGA